MGETAQKKKKNAPPAPSSAVTLLRDDEREKPGGAVLLVLLFGLWVVVFQNCWAVSYAYGAIDRDVGWQFVRQ